MIPEKTIKDLLKKHTTLEKDLSTGDTHHQQIQRAEPNRRIPFENGSVPYASWH